jgi:hypothetical protein
VPTYAPVQPVARNMNSRLEGQEWLVLLDQDNRSKMSTREVQAYVQAGKLARETLVWRAGMSDWASIGSIAELATQSSRPTVPRGQPPAKYNPRFAETVASSYRVAQYARRPAPSPMLMLELVATGAAVLLTVLATSYALYTAGAFQAGSARPHAQAHASAPAPK